MNIPRQSAIVLAVIIVAIALSGVWAWGSLDDQQSAAVAAAQELANCQELGRQITASRQSTAVAPRPGDLTSAVAAAATQAGLPEGSLDHIDPGTAAHNPDGAATQRQIEVSIRQASLRQILTFARTLSVAPLNLRAARLRLTPSDADGGGWAVQMTLTYPISGDLSE
jgi:hypothetical protein